MSQIITYRTTDDSEKVILLVKDINGGTHELGPVNHAVLIRYMEGAFVYYSMLIHISVFNLP